MTAARTGDVPTIEAVARSRRRRRCDGATRRANGADVRGGREQRQRRSRRCSRPAPSATCARRRASSRRSGLPCGRGAVDAARALLDGGADASATLPDGTSMVVLAALNQNYEAAAVLLDHGADPNAAVDGWTALHQIARVRRWTRGFNLPGPEHRDQLSSLELVRKLAARGADVNARQAGDATPARRHSCSRRGPSTCRTCARCSSSAPIRSSRPTTARRQSWSLPASARARARRARRRARSKKRSRRSR